MKGKDKRKRAAGRAAKPVSPSRKAKANPESAAAELSEKFHGRPPREVIEYPESLHVHEHLTKLGTLQELVVNAPIGKVALSGFKGAALASSEDGRQLFVIGGDQRVSLKPLGFSTLDTRDLMVLGELHRVTYRTQKGFDNFATVDYYHDLGEDTGIRPALLYNTRDNKLSIAGGQYTVKPEGIVN